MKNYDYLIPWDKENIETNYTEVLILGSGISGLFAGIKLCDKYEVTVLTKKKIMESNTEHAQGGIAVALDKDDSPEFHCGDTIKAGAGLCNLEAVRIMAENGPDCVNELINLGAKFDRMNNSLEFTREGAHSKCRILHAKGDATGDEIERTLVEGVHSRSAHVKVHENCYVVDFLKNHKEEIVGVLVLDGEKKKIEVWLAKAVIMATGGLGQLYKYTTNPLIATGDGIAAAYRAGAELMDMEFIQFHPTALLLPGAPCFLISEAARGEGARLLNSRGERFMANVAQKELAPRDIVARAIWEEMKEGPVYLDFSSSSSQWVQERFPKIYETCLKYGIDIANNPVPVGPAAHYLMGGVRIDINGSTTLPRLYACGECSCNGVHGANRLASNSLLDGLVFASAIAEQLRQELPEMPKWQDVKPVDVAAYHNAENYFDTDKLRYELQNIMWEKAGIIRNYQGLNEALKILENLNDKYVSRAKVSELELGNMLILGLIIVRSALAREESRGGHYRTDYPKSDASWQKHSVYKRGDNNVRFISI